MWQPPLTTRRSTAPRPNHAGNVPRRAPAVEEAVHEAGADEGPCRAPLIEPDQAAGLTADPCV
ncbi:hypothetical protein, partial [Streptomyces sp. PU_AKi4]|uniref:hypothetical protein n=1 Tax=Streptomyces sp. PU_AKi4 TaxID=2800809 RepID=UPI0035241243